MKMILKIGLAIAAALLLQTPSMAQTASDKLSGLSLSNDQPIQIESDRLDVREGDSVAEFIGNVSVVQGQTLLKAGKLVVYYAKNNGSATTGSAAIDRLVISDKVYVKSNTQIATGDNATFDMKSQILVMTGKEVVLSDSGNVVKGCKLTVNMKSGKASFGGKCRTGVLIDPKTAPKQ